MKYYTLFLDRDGVVNERLPGDYVRRWEEFEFTFRALDAMRFFASYFSRICMVTNQQGIGKGLMRVDELMEVHTRMREAIEQAGGRIDGIYFCPDLGSDPGNCRKPHPAMALKAQEDFPEINFSQAVMVGDSASDMEFGARLGMTTVLIEGKEDDSDKLAAMREHIHFRFPCLWAFAQWLSVHER